MRKILHSKSYWGTIPFCLPLQKMNLVKILRIFINLKGFQNNINVNFLFQSNLLQCDKFIEFL